MGSPKVSGWSKFLIQIKIDIHRNYSSKIMFASGCREMFYLIDFVYLACYVIANRSKFLRG
jgi:hypothetical protein